MTGKVAAIVPMKGNSERVPNKNVRDFNGRPLFHWILATLDSTDQIDEVVVDTDSDRIADGARELIDPTIIERPQRLRGDDVPMNEILLHDITEVTADIYLQTHCTNPLLSPDSLTEAIETYREAEAHDSLFSVTPHQMRLWNEEAEPINHERGELLPTQELDPLYEENSNIYIFTRESLERRENRIGDSPLLYSMSAKESVDIDYPIDFRFAEFLHIDNYGEKPKLRSVVEN